MTNTEKSMGNNAKLTDSDRMVLKKAYDKNNDGELSSDEIEAIINDYKNGKIFSEEVKIVLNKFDDNQDGLLQ